VIVPGLTGLMPLLKRTGPHATPVDQLRDLPVRDYALPILSQAAEVACIQPLPIQAVLTQL
jgi:hypothetical protein